MEPIESLADALGDPDKARAKAAGVALDAAVHRAARPGAPKAERAALRKGLLALVLSKRPRMVRAHAVYLLGLIGGSGEERALAPLERDPEIGEDARMARERLRRGGR